MNLWPNTRRRLANLISPYDSNKFTQAFLSLIGGGLTSYDQNAKTYLEKGYGINPDVYSIVQQQASKTISVPYYVKKIKDKDSKMRLDGLRTSTKGNYTPQQYVKSKVYELKAFEEKMLNFPMEQPNPNQTWGDVLALFKTYLSTTGNFYLYMVSPLEGINKGVPQQCYVLPSHLMQIVLKDKADFVSEESPIAGYILTEGNQYVEFEAENVIHVKLPNPFFDFQGSHLYGLSRLKSALSNIESSNEAIRNNIKTLKNGGAFGLIHGKSIPLEPEQAEQLKERLLEMDASPERLSKIAGFGAEIGFTRISLTTDELKPFDYLKFDQKTICNVLGWSDTLLNNDDGGKYDKQQKEARRVITDNIMPDLHLLKLALEKQFLPRFKGYENTVIEFDYSELPEMQEDIAELVKWLNDSLDRGVISRDEYRLAIKYPELGTPEMKAHTVSMGIQSLEDALMPEIPLDTQYTLDEKE